VRKTEAAVDVDGGDLLGSNDDQTMLAEYVVN